MSSKLDKKSLKGPDTFVSASDRAFAWIEKHTKIIGAAVGGVLLVVIAILAFNYINAQKETKATDALAAPQADLEKAQESVREARAKQMQDKLGDKKPQVSAPVDYAKDYAPAVERIKAEIKNHSGTKAALVSGLTLASFLLEQKQFEEALNVLNLVTYRPGEGDMLSGFLNMHRGLIYLENKKFDEALQSYQVVLGSKQLKYFHPEAMLKSGVVHEMKGDAAKAKATYEQLTRDFPDTEASRSARQYLRILETQSKQG